MCLCSDVLDMHPIKDAPGHCSYSVIGFLIDLNKKNKKILSRHATKRACDLPKSHAATSLCNSSVCVSMLCLAAVLACITALLTNCGLFSRRPSTCRVRVDHGLKDGRASKSSRLTLKLR